MTLEDLTTISNLVSGIAVIISLFYLAYQIKQASQIERAAGQRDILNQLRSWVELTMNDPEFFNVLRRGTHDWNDLSVSEKEQFHSWLLSILLLAEEAFYMHNDKFISTATFHGIEKAALAIVATPGGQVWWQFMRPILGKDISEHIQAELDKRPADAPHWSDLLPHWAKS